MNLRSICVGLAVTAATFALAAQVLVFAEGRGKAHSEDGRRASFQFNVRKLTDGEHVRKGGTATFEISEPRTIDGVRINMRELRELGVEDHVARFTGPGGIRFRTRSGVTERQGNVRIFARDDRRPDGSRDLRDKVGVQFESLDGNLTYSFEGVVRDGEVAVGRRESD